jgi:hypothetical protein
VAVLLLLPAVVFTLIFLTRLRSGDPQSGEAPRDWRTSWIEAAVLMGAGIALVTEMLGALRMLRLVPVGVLWIVATAGLAFFAQRHGAMPALRLASWRLWRRKVSLVLLLEVASLALIAFVVLIVALNSQPNGIDSLLYHLPRMEHWIQNGCLAPYATQYWAQAWIPPFASEAMLHLRLLSGSESAPSLVQWFSAISAAITASAIAPGWEEMSLRNGWRRSTSQPCPSSFCRRVAPQ